MQGEEHIALLAPNYSLKKRHLVVIYQSVLQHKKCMSFGGYKPNSLSNCGGPKERNSSLFIYFFPLLFLDLNVAFTLLYLFLFELGSLFLVCSISLFELCTRNLG